MFHARLIRPGYRAETFVHMDDLRRRVDALRERHTIELTPATLSPLGGKSAPAVSIRLPVTGDLLGYVQLGHPPAPHAVQFDQIKAGLAPRRAAA